MKIIEKEIIIIIFNNNSTDVTSGVSLTEKIELEFELNLGKTDYRVKNRVQ